MCVQDSAGSVPNHADVRSLLRDLRAESFPWALMVPFAAALYVLFRVGELAEPPQCVLAGTMLYATTSVAWLLRKRNYGLAVCCLVLGLGLSLLLLALWAKISVALLFLAVPVGLAALLANVVSGALAATVCTALLLFSPGNLMPLDPPLRLAISVVLWSTVGLIWLALRPLLTALQWSWSSHDRSSALLQQARDQRVELKQALTDLASVNEQLVRLNRLAQALRQEAEEARRVKEQFVTTVSHELRTPLNMIIGFSEMMLRTPETYGEGVPQPMLADLAVVLRNSQHLSSLIDDVLDLSQIEAARLALMRERIAIGPIIEDAVIAVRPLYESKGLYLRVTVPDDLPTISCDRTRIREVVLNLLSNAGRFTDRGGVVIRAWQDGSDVVVSAADTGPGIAEKDVERLFKPFGQLDGSTRRRYPGSGLGLSISKSLIDLHGGRMWLESTEGVGSTFFFSLPIAAPVSAEGGVARWFSPYWDYEERPHPSHAPAVTIRPRLVVWERGNVLRRLLTRYFEQAEIVPAASLEEAAELLAQMPAQALLVNAPSVSEAMSALAKSGPLPFDTPVIVYSIPGIASTADALGAADYLVKPVARENLLAALERLNPAGNTILVVDDEPEALRLFRRMLLSTERRWRVLRAANGRQALRILRAQPPDVVLLDLVMPDMDGFGVLEAMNTDPSLQHIPVVVISARDPAGHPIVSSALGVIRGSGLSAPQVLSCTEAISRILATAGQTPDPEPPRNQTS